MEASTLLQEIKAHGLDIQAIDGHLHVRPRALITENIRQAIRTQKTELLDFIDAYEERAAIMEFDASGCYKNRAQATAAAYEDTKIIWLERYKK